MTELIRLEILTLDSVDTLRNVLAVEGGSALWGVGIADLIEKHELRLIESEYEFDVAAKLETSDPEIPTRELDALNAERVLHMLPSLTAADATDERLWVTLALGHFSGYVQDRWNPRPQLSQHVLNHIFARTARGRERDQAISRLWWSGFYVNRLDPDNLADSLTAYFFNSDLSVQMAGRPSLSNIRTVAKSTLDAVTKHVVNGDGAYNRDAMRRYFKELDLVAGRRALGVLSEIEIAEIVDQLFERELSRATA